MELGTVGSATTSKAVTLHTTCKSLTFGSPGDINKADVLKYIHAQHLADLDFLIVVTEFNNMLLRLTNIGELASIWLGDSAFLLVNGAQSYSIITMLVLCAIRNNNIALNFYYSHGCEPALRIKHLCHSSFFADKP